MNTQTNYEAHPDFSALVAAKEKADRARKARAHEIRKTGGVQYIDPDIAAMAAFTEAEEWRLACSIAGGVPDPALAAVSQFLERRDAAAVRRV